MTSADLLADAFGRIREIVHEAADGLSPGQLAARPGGQANSIGWLIWHLTRITDDHVAAAAGTRQAWTASGWAARLGLPFGQADTGYGHGPEEVAAVRVASAELLTGYYDAVCEQTIRYVGGLADADLDRIVDERWDPPVTLGVRLVSVIADDLQHAGQAAYLRGLIEAGLLDGGAARLG
jgi:uncharacterized damage-inducible protein DinB